MRLLACVSSWRSMPARTSSSYLQHAPGPKHACTHAASQLWVHVAQWNTGMHCTYEYVQQHATGGLCHVKKVKCASFSGQTAGGIGHVN